jgi:predicted 3-demethylubiquinone-9 3-methyltransferase (glyoxalase superfamily)
MPKEKSMQKIIPFLWFDNQAEEAAHFYTSLFPNSRVLNVTHYDEGMPQPAGTAMIVTFVLDGQQYMALNGGPYFPFNEAFSMYVNCETQDEVDELWEKLSEGGEKGQCGWLKDKYGLSWQIVPTVLGDLMQDPDNEKTRRVSEALLKMNKLDIKTLKDAYKGRL